jgi:hypothetical protein
MLLLNTNTVFINVKRSTVSTAITLLKTIGGSLGLIEGNIFAGAYTDAIRITSALNTRIINNYTEVGTGIFVHFFAGTPLGLTAPVLIDGNAMRGGTTSISLNLCFPALIQNNQLAGTVNVVGVVDCPKHRTLFLNNQFVFPGAVVGTGFVGADSAVAQGYVDDMNTTYSDTTTSIETQDRAHLTGLVTGLAGTSIGPGGSPIRQHTIAHFILSIAAPGAVPGCSATAELAMPEIDLVAFMSLSVTLIDKILPSVGQLSVFASSTNHVKILWCQFSGAAVSPDATFTGTYVVSLWGYPE